jgi:nitronate monooxygenase
MTALLDRLQIDLPLLQAPMAGVSTPEMAAAVSNAGALGAIAVGATDAEGARRMIAAVRERTRRTFQVNVFCHRAPVRDPAREAAWLERLRPEFATFGATPPRALTEIYRTFAEDDAMLTMLVAERPPVVSFHFGLPSTERIRALRDAGVVLLASATNLEEAALAAGVGIDAIVAQGYEAGGHRGVFDPDAVDDRLGTMALTRLLAKTSGIPIIAAGGIMDGTGIAAALRLGAGAAQLGTAFIDTDESSADAAYRAALRSPAARHTVITRAISGRPARCLPNRFTAIGDDSVPSYPVAYDAGKALHAAAKAAGEGGYGAQWAGQGAPLSRSMPAAELVSLLASELVSAREA